MPTPKYKNVVPAASFKIKNKDVYDIKGLYEGLHEWLVQHEFCTRDDTKFGETLYLERVGSGGGKEHWIWWRLEKPSPTKYIVYALSITWHTIGITKKEIVKDGKKFKVHKGEVELDISANVVYDPKNEFKKVKFFNKIKYWFWMKKMKPRIDNHKKELYREAYQLSSAIKEFFDLGNFSGTKEHTQFWPQKGIPNT